MILTHRHFQLLLYQNHAMPANSRLLYHLIGTFYPYPKLK
nr:MAG TPA: hypothetical protein [Caudoviricetes sp.]